MTFVPSVAPIAPPSERARWLVFEGGGFVVHAGDGSALLEGAEVRSLGIDAGIYLGRLDGDDCYVARLPEGASIGEGHVARPLRSLLMELDAERGAVAGRAAQILHWDETHRFCGRCGARTERSPIEHCRVCPACALSAYPRVAPAVIVLVRRGDRALLARSGSFPRPFFSTLAGFVEPGETLEQAAVREIREEVGVDIGGLRYFGSQPWPFPHSLMVGFTAEHAGGELRVDGVEIAEADFFAAAALPLLPPRLSIARRMIDAWLAEQGLEAP